MPSFFRSGGVFYRLLTEFSGLTVRLRFFLLVLFGLSALFLAWERAGARFASAEEPDGLELRMQNGLEVLGPNDPVVVQVQPRQTSRENALHLTVALHACTHEKEAGSLWKRKRAETPSKLGHYEQDVFLPPGGDAAWIPVTFAPLDAGVYEIVATLQTKPDRGSNSLLSLPNQPFQRRQPKTLAEKSLQFVIVSTAPVARPVGPLPKELLETLDTTSPAWWKRFTQVPSLPRVGNLVPNRMPELPRLNVFRERSPQAGSAKTDDRPVLPAESFGPILALQKQRQASEAGPFGSGHLRQPDEAAPATGAGGLSAVSSRPKGFTVLQASDDPALESWQAFPLSIREPGTPHLIELDYPEAISQSLGVGIVEFLDRNGETVPCLTAENGVFTAPEIVSAVKPGGQRTHSVLFWPKTSQPMLLLSNPGRNESYFGKIRLYRLPAGETELAVPKPSEGSGQRLVAAYLHQGDFLEEWSRPLEIDPATGRRIAPDDWNDLLDVGRRLVASLAGNHYDGAMIPVLSNRLALFPSEKTLPPPLGESAPRDAVGLWLRLFERENLVLVPAIRFDMPLRDLEARIRQNPALAEELVYGDTNRYFPEATRYNLLHPMVQEAMLDLIREQLARYGRSPSFGGIAVHLNPDGYAQLPPFQRLDDATFRQFLNGMSEETRRLVPAELHASAPRETPFPENREQTLPARMAARARFFHEQPKFAEAWLRWRTEQIGAFYARMAGEVVQTRPDAKLYLAGATVLDHPELRPYCVPSISRRTSLVYPLRLLGLDVAELSKIPSLVFLRPTRVGPPESSDVAASYSDFDSAEMAQAFASGSALPGSLFFRDASRGRNMLPAEHQSRRRFVRQLAQSDLRVVFDGGRTLPAGESGPLSAFWAAFRKLPNLPFQEFTQPAESRDAKANPPEAESLQPLTVRFARVENRLVVYLVNDAPFGVDADLSFAVTGNGRLVELGGLRKVNEPEYRGTSASWSVALEPYDFVAVALEDPGASLRRVKVRRPREFCDEGGVLEQEIDRFRERIQTTARFGVRGEGPANADFEVLPPSPPAPPGDVPHWTSFGNPRLTVSRDDQRRFSGQASLRISGDAGLKATPGAVFSDAFPVPTTGRLYAVLHVGIPETAGNLPVNVLLSARHRDRPLYRSYTPAPDWLPSLLQATPVSGIRWQQIVVPFDRLPIDSMEDLRIGFELTDRGEVWIDNLRLFQVSLSRQETNEFLILVNAADVRRRSQRYSELLAILEGYWAGFLAEHAPAAAPETASGAPTAVRDQGQRGYADNAAKKEETKPPEKKAGFMDRVRGVFGY